MIHSIKIKNFYSIKDEQSISFVASGRVPANDGYLESVGEQLSKVNLFVGANGSGKTNVLKALSFVGWLLSSSFGHPVTADLPFKSFFNTTETSEIEVVFADKDRLFTYFVECDSDKILEERLSVNQLVETRRKDKILLSRKYDKITGNYIFEGDAVSSKLLANSTVIIERKNASVVAIGAQFAHPVSLEVANYWHKINTNVFERGYGGDDNFSLIRNLLEFKMNPQSQKKVERVLRKFDLGFDSLSFVAETAGDNMNFKEVKEIHIFDGRRFENDINYASQGTRRLISIIQFVLLAIENQVPVILDEIEAFLHPDILREIIDLFIDPDVVSQLIFTSHSHIVMNKLDKNQIYLTEKNPKTGSTEVYNLASITGVRADDNYYNKYIAGAYGAIPRI